MLITDTIQTNVMAFKIYTKTGDSGTTGLFGGARIPKHNLRIEAYGTVDELNAHLGYLVDLSEQYDCSVPHLEFVQNELFNLQCWALTAESFLDVEEWVWLYQHFGYTGDYEFIFFE